jgi:hypothetical protein
MRALYEQGDGMMDPKSWVEIVLMPLVVALVGIIGTITITNQQAENAALLRKTELEKTQEIADADRQIKILEIFSEKITSSDEKDRILAIRLLTALDGSLATKLATAVSESADKNSDIRRVAKEVSKQSELIGNSFPVVFSTKNYDVAVEFANKINDNSNTSKPEIYMSDNGYFAVTLGGYLSYSEAQKRSTLAVKMNLSKDAYIRTSTNWGENLLQ